MKHLRSQLSILVLVLATSGAQSLFADGSKIPVYLSPDVSATKIGDLESVTLAVDATWPKDSKAIAGWRPIFYRGAFDVYVSNESLAKDLSPKPGIPYLLSNDRNATTLALATAEDKTDLISVDPRYSRLSVETILLAYIKDDSRTADAVRDTISTGVQLQGSNIPVRTLTGRLFKSTASETRRTKCEYKILGKDNKPLAYVDTSELPEFVLLNDYIGAQVTASGRLSSIGETDTLSLSATSIKKTN